ncbi:MAG: hypothetical protein NC187_08165 [Candidatus Amulumruptor caecigallinarius]|nr:hypothetical protein [Candidatus Amulumruptor caecigallinarius]MCM1397443.1 hypothetical protein [Candidatus Amulumruptor caecigallinarius]MCM1454349.1 hypothetical protein [bacterium]
MKTIHDLRSIIPTIVALLAANDHQVGESSIERDEDGWGRCDDFADNCLTYEGDGWYIEVYYQCSGEWEYDPGDYWTPSSSDLRKAWGEVTEITASHYDDETGEESEFSGDDLTELWQELDKVLENIA